MPETDYLAEQRAVGLMKIKRLARLLDGLFPVPGTNMRVGLDGLLGLIPVIGDAVTTLLSAYLIYSSAVAGAPFHILAKMIGNLTLDIALGSVPVLGDVADIAWKANNRNYKLLSSLEEHRLSPRDPAKVRTYIKWGIAAILIGLVAAALWLAVTVIRLLGMIVS